MKPKSLKPVTLLVTAILLLSACLPTSSVDTAPLNQETISALAGATLSVLQTEEARNATATFTPIPFTDTPIPTSTPTETLLPSSTPLPTNTPIPTWTPLPSPTASNTPGGPTITPLTTVVTGGSGGSGGSAPATPVPPCNWAQFVLDVTVPDGTIFSPGAYFTKIWRVRNIGSCTWNTKYTLVYESGAELDGSTLKMPESVAPGETIDLAVNLQAPDKIGKYTGYWLFKSDANVRFGIGSSTKDPLTVKIEVKDTGEGIVYDFISNYCAADWQNKTTDLPCPGSEGSDDGFVIRVDNPALESRNENEPALETFPEAITDGLIQGTYPEIEIKSGDRFLADIGCLADNERCDVLFQLKYTIDGGDEVNFGRWRETYDGNITRVDMDLSALAGEKVQFILVVKANGAPREDAAFWLVPKIIR
jgi:hypothetical protein